MNSRITNLCAILGVIIAIMGLYLPYRNELNHYLYEKDFLTGKWSTNAGLVINSGDLGLDKLQPIVIMQLIINDDGSIDGEIISEELCDAMPLTWYITMNSDKPSILNFIFSRTFQIRQLVNGAMDKSPVVATMKLISEDRKHQTITFQVKNNATSLLPKKLIFAKNLPEFEEDYNYLQDYCAESTKIFHEKMASEMKKFIKVSQSQTKD